MIRLDKRGRRIAIFSDAPLKGLKTAVPGAYQTTAGYWTVPLSFESCVLLKQKYDGQLQVSQELQRWVRTVQSTRRSMADLASAEHAKLYVLPNVAPKLYEAMLARPYQLAAVRFGADSPAFLNADEPGLGKTLETMGAVLEAELPGPYLVVCPKTASEAVWRPEIARWLPRDHKAITLPQQRIQREKKLVLTHYGPKTWLIVHPEILMVQAYWVCAKCDKRTVEGKRTQKRLSCGHSRDRRTRKEIEPSYPRMFDIQWGAIIADESHESLIIRRGVPTQRRRGFDMLQIRPDGKRICASGSPWDSKPEQLFGTLNWLYPTVYTSFHSWAELYWSKGGYTGFEIGDFRKDREPMLWHSLGAVAIRRTKEEVAPDLPPKAYIGTLLHSDDENSPIGVWLPMDGKQAAAYRQMEEQSWAELDTGRLDAVSALAALTRLKQLAISYGDIIPREVKVHCQKTDYCTGCKIGWHREARFDYIPKAPSNKLEWILGTLEEWGFPRNPISKVIIAGWFTGILGMFAREIHRHFKIKPDRPLCSAITGRIQSAERRAEIIRRFNARDHEAIMLLNVKAGGSAITIDTADRMINIGQTRNPVAREMQTEDRIHRVSNPRHCMYYYLASEGTVDIGTAIVNEEAKRNTHRLLDGRRGLEYTRMIRDLSHT